MIGRPADQNKSSVAIFAFDETNLVDFHPDSRMAERGGYVARSVAHDTREVYTGYFGRLLHADPLTLRYEVV